MNFEKELKDKKLKVTPQRIAILKEIKCSGHASIEEIYDKIKEHYPSTSLATIYKNVATLCETNILTEIKAPGYKQKYEIRQTSHVHVACEKCGKLEDLHVDFEALKNNCTQASGYSLHDLSAVFIGVCPSCRNPHKTLVSHQHSFSSMVHTH